MVGGVEADEGRVEADVGLGDVGAEEVWRVGGVGEVRFEFVEGGEEREEVLLVGGLGGGEAGFVDAVVDGVVDLDERVNSGQG